MQVKVVNDSLCPPFPPKPAAVGLIVVQRLIAVFRSANRVEHLILRQQQQTGCRSSRMRNTDSFCVADFWPFGCYRPLLFEYGRAAAAANYLFRCLLRLEISHV
jgi:hypothetical protein